ncbi:putative ABC transporter protein [Rosellinia necatrix]|uniref:Putative ABC transporter protein n=1 Tax=Rosellinia necatrix TaxID=77044 RepID=A0A1S8A8H0_ROSNE|nr:putative ABC transporter protein [Rosellinia necatrix]
MSFLYRFILPGILLTVTAPPVFVVLPMSTFTNVDLPAPEPPMTAVREPRSIEPVTFWRIGLGAPLGWKLRLL